MRGYDIEQIILMLRELQQESPQFNTQSIDYDYVAANLYTMVERPEFIGTIDVSMRGFMFGTTGPSWYCPDLIAYEHLLYILPEHRGGILAARLIRSFESIARTRGCVLVRAGTSTRIRAEQTLALYERLGYTRDTSGVFKRIN